MRAVLSAPGSRCRGGGGACVRWSNSWLFWVTVFCPFGLIGVPAVEAQLDQGSASPFCPNDVDPVAASLLPQCNASTQCDANTVCPGTLICCLSLQVAAPSKLCVGKTCTCPDITAKCPSLNCGRLGQKTDAIGCSTCACQTATSANGSCSGLPKLDCTTSCQYNVFDLQNCQTCQCALSNGTKSFGVCPSASVSPAMPTCPSNRTCTTDYQCPLVKKCCSGVSTTGGPLCSGMVCQCPTVTVAACQARCPGSRASLVPGKDGCSWCKCHLPTTMVPEHVSHPVTATPRGQVPTGGPTTKPNHAVPTVPIARADTSANSQAPQQPSKHIEFDLFTSQAGIAAIKMQKDNFQSALAEFLVRRYNMQPTDIQNLQATEQCCTSSDVTYLSITFVLLSQHQATVDSFARLIANDAKEQRISLAYATLDGRIWQLVSGVVGSKTRAPSATSSPEGSSPSSGGSALIIYVCASVGAVLVIVIVILAVFLLKRNTGRAEFYADPAPGVHFEAATGAVGQASPPVAPFGKSPVLVFDHPMYDSNSNDTVQLAQDF